MKREMPANTETPLVFGHFEFVVTPVGALDISIYDNRSSATSLVVRASHLKDDLIILSLDYRHLPFYGFLTSSH